MSFKTLIPAAALAAVLLAVCSHDFNNPVDPINAPDNEAPHAEFFMTPNPVYARDTVHFDATNTTDANDDLNTLQARWDFDSDGNWELDWAGWDMRKLVTQIYLNAGTYKVALEVQDPAGDIDRREKQITVNVETAPFAHFTINPKFGEPINTTFTVDANSSRDESGNTNLEYRWKFKKDQNFWNESELNNPVRQCSYQAGDVGQQMIVLQVKDVTKNTFATASVQFDVSATGVTNRYPTAWFEASTARGTVGNQITFDASGSTDPDAADVGNLLYRWGYGDTAGYGAWSTNPINQVTFNTSGARTIWLQVKDQNATLPLSSTAWLRMTVN